MKKQFTVKFDVPVVKRTKSEIPVTMNVKGMMIQIKRCMPDKDKQDLLDEYAKFAMMDMAGVETYPLVDKSSLV